MLCPETARYLQHQWPTWTWSRLRTWNDCFGPHIEVFFICRRIQLILKEALVRNICTVAHRTFQNHWLYYLSCCQTGCPPVRYSYTGHVVMSWAAMETQRTQGVLGKVNEGNIQISLFGCCSFQHGSLPSHSNHCAKPSCKLKTQWFVEQLNRKSTAKQLWSFKKSPWHTFWTLPTIPNFPRKR